MPKIFWWVALLILLAPFASRAAEPIPATVVKEYKPADVERWFSTASAACAAQHAEIIKSPTPGYSYQLIGAVEVDATRWTCRINFVRNEDGVHLNSSNSSIAVRNKYTCPSGYALSGDMCIPDPTQCEAGYVKDASGKCVPKPVDPYWDTDDGKCNVANNLWNTTGNPDRSGRVSGKIPLGKPTNVCVDSGQTGSSGKPLGCIHEFTGSASFDTGSGWVTEGDSWGSTGISTGPGNQNSGMACALGLGETDPEKPVDAKKPDADCKGGQKGQVNGKDVCIDRSSGEQTGVDWARTTDPTGKPVDVTTEVTCKRESCTVTETRKPVGGGDPLVTVTPGVDRGNYCNTNPKNPVCRAPTDPSGSTRGNGNGSTGGNNGTGNENGESEGIGDVGSVGNGKDHEQPELYESKYPKGIKGVWEDSGVGGEQGKFNALARSFMPQISDNGGAPLSFKIPMNLGIVNFGILDVSPPAAIWPFIRICILITALWLARSLVFGG